MRLLIILFFRFGDTSLWWTIHPAVDGNPIHKHVVLKRHWKCIVWRCDGVKGVFFVCKRFLSSVCLSSFIDIGYSNDNKEDRLLFDKGAFSGYFQLEHRLRSTAPLRMSRSISPFNVYNFELNCVFDINFYII